MSKYAQLFPLGEGCMADSHNYCKLQNAWRLGRDYAAFVYSLVATRVFAFNS